VALGDCDRRLVGLAEALRQMLDGRDADWMLAHLAEIKAGLALMTAGVRERQSLLK
jgi:hypothetical protein